MQSTAIQLTPNRRLAAFLAEANNAAQLHQRRHCWEGLQVFPVQAWLEQLYNDAALTDNLPQLLTPVQQRFKWEQIIAQHEVGLGLVNVTQTAALVQKAWQLVQQTRLSLTDVAAACETLDPTLFLTWADRYQAWCLEQHYTDTACLVNCLIEYLQAHPQFVVCRLPQTIECIGFDEIPADLAALWQRLTEAGVRITHPATTQPVQDVQTVACQDFNHEIEQAALWAKAQLKANPDLTLGIVIPELAQQRDIVVAAMQAHFKPHQLNIAAPSAINRQPMVQTALAALNLLRSKFEFEAFSYLIRSPYFEQGDEAARAQVDVRLRRTLEATNTWPQLLARLPQDTPLWQVWQSFAALIPTLPKRASCQAWVMLWQHALAILGWPGCPHGALLQDLAQCWLELLQDYLSLSDLLGSHDLATALYWLQRLAKDKPFLPQSKAANIHVLGVLEAAGLKFDACWLCQMGWEMWPPAAMPNPYLPRRLQRRYQMPRSSPERELAIAKRITARILNQGLAQLRVSFSGLQPGTPARISTLFDQFPQVKAQITPLLTKTPAAHWHWREDSHRPPDLARPLRGAQCIQFQAQCPFKAHACISLSAEPLIWPQDVLTAATRGEILHEILAACKLDAATLPQAWPHNKQVVSKVLSRWARRFPSALNAWTLVLESERLQQLVQAWMQIEATRANYTIIAKEQTCHLQLGEVKFSLRVDRVDKLAQDTYLVIDYKSGLLSTTDWFSEPPRAPQLPMYALLQQWPLAGVAVAQINPREITLKGVAEAGPMPTGVQAIQWGKQQANWRQQLTTLATAFAVEYPEARPVGLSATCRNCWCQPICRIYAAEEICDAE